MKSVTALLFVFVFLSVILQAVTLGLRLAEYDRVSRLATRMEATDAMVREGLCR